MTADRQLPRRARRFISVAPLDLWLSLALFAGTFALFCPALGYPFQALDDNVYVWDNPQISRGLTWQSARWALGAEVGGNWHPFTVLSHQLDVTLWGLQPRGHHRTNLWLHTAAAVALYVALVRMTARRAESFFAAAIFAWHPLRVESVVWIAERKDVLSGLLAMLTLWFYAGYAQRGGLFRYFEVLITFALGLLAKPMLVTLPFVFLLLDYWPLERWHAAAGAGSSQRSARFLIGEKVPLFVLAATDSVITYLLQHGSSATRSTDILPLGLRLANMADSYVEYLRDFFWPSGLAIFYPHPATRISLVEVGASTLALLLFSLAAWKVRRRAPQVLVGWLWFLGMLVPVAGLVQVGGAARADRYTYLPSVGLAIALAWLVGDVARRGNSVPGSAAPPKSRIVTALSTIAALGWLTALGAGTVEQVARWRDDATLYAYTAHVTQGNFFAETCWGDALAARADWAGASAHYRAALAIFPSYDRAILGQITAQEQLQNRDGLLDAYRQAATLELLSPETALGYVQAIETLEPEARGREYEAWIALQPAHPLPLTGLARFELRFGRPARAIVLLRQALALEAPGAGVELQRDARFLAAWVWATDADEAVRDPSAAGQLVDQHACFAPGGTLEAADVRAGVMASLGQFHLARQTLDNALQSANVEASAEYRRAVAERAKHYERRRMPSVDFRADAAWDETSPVHRYPFVARKTGTERDDDPMGKR